MTDTVRAAVQSTVLGFTPGDIVEVDPNDEAVAAAIAGQHLVVVDENGAPVDAPELQSLTGAVTPPETEEGSSDTTDGGLHVDVGAHPDAAPAS